MQGWSNAAMDVAGVVRATGQCKQTRQPRGGLSQKDELQHRMGWQHWNGIAQSMDAESWNVFGVHFVGIANRSIKLPM